MDLNFGFLVSPNEVISLGLRECDAAGGYRLGLFHIKLVSCPDVEGTRPEIERGSDVTVGSNPTPSD
jgi:hypothetical protein